MKMKQLFFLLTSCCALMACSSDETATSRHTGFRLMLTDGVACETGRAVPSELPKPVEADFSLVITNTTTGREAYNGKFKSEIPVAEGTYLLRAAYGSDPSLAWDTPYYEGTEVATAAGESETVVTLACKVANALLSAEFVNPEVFRKYYSDYGLEVRVAHESLVIKDDGETGSAYFKAQSAVKLTFQATLRSNGVSVSKELTADGATYEAGTHTRLSLEAGIPEAGAVVSVSKVAVTDVTVNETLPNAWLPAPKVGHFNGGNSRSLDYVETADAVEATIPLTASAPMEEIAFTIDFNDEHLRDLNGDYTLSQLTDEQKAMFADKGIVLPQLGTTATSFDLKGMTPALLTQAGADVANHIQVKVRANERESEPATFTITTKKPQFSVRALDTKVWSKEFTVEEAEVSTGNAATIKADLKYQYSADGVTWTDCNNGLVQKFASHPANKNYQVRALYRGSVPSATADVTLETPAQLPNSGMEEWDTSTSKGKTKMYNPWTTNGDKWWDTDNQYTTRYDVSRSTYNCFPAVSYTRNAHSGNFAAELRNTGAGPGGTGGMVDWLSIMNDCARAPGILFSANYTGTTSSGWVDSGSFTYDRGRVFTDRPTAMEFYYTYSPLNNDQFRVYIELMHDTEVIGSGELIVGGTVSDYTKGTININYTGTVVAKATKIFVVFLSSAETTQGNIPCKKNVTVTLADEGNKKTHAGSILRIDDISLVYDK